MVADPVRVLHVDDDPALLDLAATMLEREGLDVVTAESAEAGLAVLEEEPAECVVSDYQMPGTDGLEFLEAVREEYPDLPFVLFTGQGSEEIAAEAISAGVTDYLQKETGVEQYAVLANRVERVVGERRAEAALAESERMLSTLISNLPGMVYRCRNERGWPMEFVGGSVEELTGYAAEALESGAVVWGEDVLHPDDRERLWEEVQTALAAGDPFEVTYRIRRADGGIRWVWEQGRAVSADATDPGPVDPDGGAASDEGVHLEGFVADVTERYEHDRQLEELHAATRDLVQAESREEIATVTNGAVEETLGHPICVMRLVDGSGEKLTPVTVSESTRELVGDRPDYVVGEDLPGEAFASGELIAVDDVREIDDDQDRGAVRAAMYVPIGDHGILSIGTPIAEGFDETDRQLATILAANAEVALDRLARREELERERDHLAALFENIPDPAVRSEGGGAGRPVVTAVNSAFEETFGYDAETLVGENLDDYIVPEGARQEAHDLNTEVSADKQVRREVRRETADGVRDFLLHVGRFEDDQGEHGFAVYTDITDQKRRERELEEYERQFTAVFEDPDSFVGLLDPDGTLRRANQASLDFLDLDHEDVVGELFWETPWWGHSAEARETLRDAIERAAEGEFVRFETSNDPPDGDRVVMANSVRPVHDGEAVVSLIVEARDVTEARERDRRLRELHDAVRNLVDAETAEDIAEVTARAAGDVLDYPLNSVRLYDAEAEALVPAAVPPEAVEAIGERPTYAVDGESPPARAFRTGEVQVFDDVREIDDGYDRDALESAMYFPLGERGTLSIGAVESDPFDDADRQLATVLAAAVGTALDRVARREELERERNHLAALFENIPEPTISVTFEDGEPIVRDVNPAFEETFGYDAGTLAGENVDDFIVPPEKQPEASEYNARIQAGQPFHGEVRRQAVDGVRDFLLHVVPHTVGERSTRGFAIYTDITEQKERERELERQNERLDAFASVVSHDLRNPLSVAEGYLDLARESGDDEHFAAVERAHGRMGDLIDGLLELARQGQSVGETEPVDLATVVTAAWNAVEHDDAELVVDEELPTVLADRARLCQLLENLFRNSVEHGSTSPQSQTPEDTVEHSSPSSRPAADGVVATDDGGADGLRVTVGSLGGRTAERGPVTGGFYVADDGPGIPVEEREDVFEFGYTSTDGTGLGLAIVREIAEAHGWSVTVTESPDGGACFEFTGVETATDRDGDPDD